MDFTPEEKAALILGRSGQVDGLWMINPGGRIVSCPLSTYSGRNAMGHPKGRKYDYGYRIATPDEIAVELNTTVVANKKAAEKKVVLTKIIHDEPVKADEASELDYSELKAIAKKKGIKTFGKKKEVLAAELGLA
jgi:hypothetical protein